MLINSELQSKSTFIGCNANEFISCEAIHNQQALAQDPDLPEFQCPQFDCYWCINLEIQGDASSLLLLLQGIHQNAPVLVLASQGHIEYCFVLVTLVKLWQCPFTKPHVCIPHTQPAKLIINPDLLVWVVSCDLYVEFSI